jgi:hypothetical protein
MQKMAETLVDQDLPEETYTAGTDVPTGPEATDAGLVLTDAEMVDPEDQILADLQKQGADEGIDIEGRDVQPAPAPVEGEGGGDGSPAPDQAPAPAAAAQPPNTVPVAAFTKVRGELNRVQRENDTLRGQAAAYMDMAKTGNAAGETEPDVDPNVSQLEGLKADKRAAFEKYENSEIDQDEYNDQVESLDEQMFDVRSTIRDAETAATRPSTDAAPQMDSGVEQAKVQLRNQYPVMKALGNDGMTPYIEKVVAHFDTHGFKLDARNPLHVIEVQKRAAKLADDTFRNALGNPSPKPDNPDPAAGNGPTPTPPPGAPTELSPEAKERAAKLALAGNQPPNLDDQGEGPNTGALTDEQIELRTNDMTEEERAEFFEANPALVQRILGHTAL